MKNKSNFLDDELFEICKNFDINSEEDVNTLYGVIMGKCENYFKSRIKFNMTFNDSEIIFKRLFHLYDSFVCKLEKEGGELQILAKLFKKHSFKKNFLENNKELSNHLNLFTN